MPLMTRLGALKITDPMEWKAQITTAMEENEGRVDDAASALDISSRQLFRWLALPELKDIKRAEFGLPRDGKRGRRAKPKKVIQSRRRK